MQLRQRAIDAWHLIVHLHDQVFGRTSNLAGIIVAGAQSKKPMSVHGRHGYKEGVDADVLSQQPGGLMEVARNIGEHFASAILLSPLDQGALDLGDEHAIWLN